MTTSVVNAQIQHTTDAEFRAWGSQLSAQLTAIGLTKTADTGQIDFTTVLRPGANIAAGYEIWRFNDTLQGARPIYFKIEYGTASTTTNPNIWITIGTGSNGAGTITNITTIRTATSRAGNLGAAVACNSYGCYSAAVGAFFFDGWNGSFAAAPLSFFAFGISRSCDDDGTPNGEGYCFYWLNTTTLSANFWSYLTGSGTGPNTSYSFVPGSTSNSAFGTDINVYKHFTMTPRMRPLPGMLTYCNTEIGKGGSFACSPFGTSHTYMALGDGINQTAAAGTTSHVLAMLWE